jgi:prolyl oligopeptidase
MTSAVAVAAETIPPVGPNDPPDPYTWLEAAESQQSLAWVKQHNERTLAELQGDPRYQGLYDAALKIVTATDRIPTPAFRSGVIDNFWQDATHVRGLWRRTSLDSYRTVEPAWETVLDIDALARAENANWVYEGATCLPPAERLCLVGLSNGGKDAATVREFDARSHSFVQGGFMLPEDKQNYDWLDENTLLLARAWSPGEVTESGYPYVLKEVKRGQPLSAARELFRGEKTDVSVSPWTVRDADGVVQAVIAVRSVSFFENQYWLLGGAQPVQLPIPAKSSVRGLVKGQLVFTIEQDWPERGFKIGDVLAYDLAALKRDPAAARPTLILRPGARESVEAVQLTRNHLVVALFENVRGGAYVYDFNGSTWTRRKLDLPQNVSVSLGSSDDRTDRLFITATGYVEPTTLFLADAETGRVEPIKQSPARFNAEGLVVEQFEARSKDGTMVPYFVVHRRDIKLDGSNPTLLYAYGGFQSSMLPAYSGTVGKLWLERGGVYVVANIRGGGEFGPSWWSQGLKENRQRVFDDYIGVAEDLIASHITSPRRLGIEGGSNGGLLMGAAMTQRPELFHAAVIQVPLFDMIRYTHIGAGASWVGEYGDPAIPAEREYILRYSPYQHLVAGRPYPEPLFVTSTKDDRVSPAHARKAVARKEELGYPVLFYENTDGGHAAAANLNETAKRISLEYMYLTRKLMD